MESCSRGFRVKLVFAEDFTNMRLPHVWFYVNPQICKTITDLKRVIQSRFKLHEVPGVLQIWLQDFVIPDGECIHVINAEDILILRKDTAFNSLSPSVCHPLGDVQPTVDVGAEIVGIEHRHRECHSQVESHPRGHFTEQSRRKELKDEGRNGAQYVDNSIRISQPVAVLSNGDFICEDVVEQSSSSNSSRKFKKCKKQQKESTVPPLVAVEGGEENICRTKKHKRCQTDNSFDNCISPVVPERVPPEVEDTKSVKRCKRRRHRKSPSTGNMGGDGEGLQSEPKFNSTLKTNFASPSSSSAASQHIRFDEGSGPLGNNNVEETVEDGVECHVKSRVELCQHNSSTDPLLLPQVPQGTNGTLPVDYTKYPQLKCHPRINDVIAYKVLELSEDYSPEVSNFKVGQVVNFNPDENIATINFLNPITVKTLRGKFEVISSSEDEDGEDTRKLHESILTSTTLEWNFVVEARLIADRNY